jgi:hypothetical protein
MLSMLFRQYPGFQEVLLMDFSHQKWADRRDFSDKIGGHLAIRTPASREI